MFFLYNINKSDSKAHEIDLHQFHASCFKMETCQRKLLISSTKVPSLENDPCVLKLESEKAYEYLLEMICGLKSRLIAENEIVSQYRNFLSSYLKEPGRDSSLLAILQKLLKDHKFIRTHYLKGISQRTYAAITKKLILNEKPQIQKILIWGSGSLSEDLINQFKKKTEVFICARNSQRVSELSEKHQIQSIDWKDFAKASKIDVQVNTIGAKENIFDASYLKHLQSETLSFFADLGAPSPLSDEFSQSIKESAKLINLEEIFSLGALAKKEKLEKITAAKQEIQSLSIRRLALLNKKNTYKHTENYV